MSNNLFRNESLDNLHTPGQINDFVKVTTPPLYIVLMAMTICSVVACLWVTLGTVTEHVQSVAVVFPHATPNRIYSPKNGTVAQLLASKGSNVGVGTPLLVVRHDNTSDTLLSNVNGRLINIKNVDDTFRGYETLAEIIPDAKSALNTELITYVEYKDLRSLKPGLEVQVTPVDLHREDYGYIRGHITSVNHFPAGYIKNLKVRTNTSKTTKGGDYSALLIGRMVNGKIENVDVQGTVEGTAHVGGVVAISSGNQIPQVHHIEHCSLILKYYTEILVTVQVLRGFSFPAQDAQP